MLKQAGNHYYEKHGDGLFIVEPDNVIAIFTFDSRCYNVHIPRTITPSDLRKPEFPYASLCTDPERWQPESRAREILGYLATKLDQIQ